MPDNLTWLDTRSIPIDLQGEDWELISEAHGRTYQVRCGSGEGVVSISSKTKGRVQCKYHMVGYGAIRQELTSEGRGTYVNHHRGSGKGSIKFGLLTIAYGVIRQDLNANHKANPTPITTQGTGKGYVPLWSTTDLNLLFPYMSNFLPEVAEQAPSPLPEQDQIVLNVLDHVIKGVNFHGDTKLWTLIGVTYQGNPVMTLRNFTNSPYPVRHVTDLTQYKLMIGYLARLWDVYPIGLAGAPPGPMTQAHIRDLHRKRMSR